MTNDEKMCELIRNHDWNGDCFEYLRMEPEDVDTHLKHYNECNPHKMD